MNGFILAAGFGKRMGKYTQSTPKPLLDIQGIRLLDYSLYLCKMWGIKSVLVNTHYLGEQIEKYLKNFQAFPVFLSKEEKILGTGGGIAEGLRRYPKFLEDDLLILNPDTLLFPDEKISFAGVLERYPDSDCHLYLSPYQEGSTYTKLFLVQDGILGFEEKKDSQVCYYIGLALLSRSFLSRVLRYRTGFFEMGQIWKDMSYQGRLTGSLFPGKAVDVGDASLYEALLAKEDSLWDEESKRGIASLFHDE